MFVLLSNYFLKFHNRRCYGPAMHLIPKFIAAAFAKPDVPVADLDSLARVQGGSGLRVHVAVNRYAGFAAAAYGESGQCDLYKNGAGGWDLVLSKKYGLRDAPKNETVGTFPTLEEAVPFLRAASDILRQKYSGFWAAAGGCSYSESAGADGLAAVERALASRKQIPSAPGPRL
jgi:hypothetical protein